MTRVGFIGKGNKVYSSDEGENRVSQPLKLCHSTAERKCLLFKGEFRSSVQGM
jgi:hypothetical protein